MFTSSDTEHESETGSLKKRTRSFWSEINLASPERHYNWLIIVYFNQYRFRFRLVWRQPNVIFADHVRSTREGNVFTGVCYSVQGRGELGTLSRSPWLGGGEGEYGEPFSTIPPPSPSPPLCLVCLWGGGGGGRREGVKPAHVDHTRFPLARFGLVGRGEVMVVRSIHLDYFLFPAFPYPSG